MANERTAGEGASLADQVDVTNGSTNGNGRTAGSVDAASSSPVRSSYSGIATTRSPAGRPAPAVPLVPPVRSGSTPAAPVAPVARTGRPATVAPAPKVVAPVIVASPQQSSAPTPPAPSRSRPPVRTRIARRPRVRKVNRVVRRVDAWSVFKIALVFWIVFFVILLVAGMLLWNLAETTGTITNVEGFIKDLFGLKTFEFDGGQILRSSWIIGLVLVVGGTAFTVTLTVLFNLISDLLGGVRVTVLEEEVLLRPSQQALAEAPAARSR